MTAARGNARQTGGAAELPSASQLGYARPQHYTSTNAHDLLLRQHFVENIVPVHGFENYSELLPLEVYRETLRARYVDGGGVDNAVIGRSCSGRRTPKPAARSLVFIRRK